MGSVNKVWFQNDQSKWDVMPPHGLEDCPSRQAYMKVNQDETGTYKVIVCVELPGPGRPGGIPLD